MNRNQQIESNMEAEGKEDDEEKRGLKKEK